MRSRFVFVFLVMILATAVLPRAQWWPFGGDRADLRVQVAELQLTERQLREENAALAASSRTLRTELERLRGSEVEIERLRGELARALS